MLVGPSKCLKQIIQIELNRVKKTQLAGGKPRISTRDYREQIQLAVGAGLELGASELQVQRSNRSATLPKNRLVTYFTEVTAPVRKSSPQGNGISK